MTASAWQRSSSTRRNGGDRPASVFQVGRARIGVPHGRATIRDAHMPALIDDLLDPRSLPDETTSVSLVQTHISLVFVADRFVYKVKKPVNFGFLDFSTLDRRRHFCHQEVLLNSRLSKDLYLGVLPITYDGRRHRLGKDGGEVVEYAVKMKRIPDEFLMKSVFSRGELTREHLERIAGALAAFHGSAATSPEIREFGRPEAFKVNTDENFEQTERFIGATISQEDFCALRDWTSGFYVRRKGLFEARMRSGRIRDCHGDLHMEHICLTEDLHIFDCIEFNDRFRYSDTLSDIAFLVMDLEYHGGEEYSKMLWEIYQEWAGERDVEALLTFYKVYRAYVRGKVTSFQLDDESFSPTEKERAAQWARRYFELARKYIEEE